TRTSTKPRDQLPSRKRHNPPDTVSTIKGQGPIARLQSEYLMRHERRTDLRLDEDYVEDWALRQFAFARRDPFHLDNHMRAQSEFLLEEAVVYRLEDGLNEAIQDLNTRFGISGPTHIPREKVGGEHRAVSSRDVRVSARLRAKLLEQYSADFEVFGYDR
ncbi:sulfotransferase family 2 domain-containing protein, partial [Microbacterium sp. NPDC076895]|uniref:sulfotransferase family 2 domain-containing protein n=1 Tax=Microbacterium sp. NPDC076895 TaxID=3154957 RepID=UPI00343CA3AA